MSINLIDYGFTGADILAAGEIIKEKNKQDLIPARIIEAQRGRYRVICERGEVTAELKGSFYYKNENDEPDCRPREASPGAPVVGDFVIIKFNDNGASLIDDVINRRSYFSRVDFLGHLEGYAKNVREQVLAANFDYVFIMSSLNHDLNVNRISRYLTASLQGGGFPVIVLTKADLIDDSNSQDTLGAKIAEVRKIAKEAPVIAVSSKTGLGLEELSPFLESSKTVIFLGSSGVGKSSLLNRLAEKNLMEVKEIRDDDSKGRHTTTYRQLFRLDCDALVIDTPGMREIGLWDSSEGISLAFAEVEELFAQCKFNDCNHQSEPGCAVLAALEEGSLSEAQWKNYQAQNKENNFVNNHSEYLRQKNAFHKKIAMYNKERQR